MAAVDGGIVTSTSLMVRWPHAGEAAARARSRPALSVGLHIDVGEWVYREGVWAPLYQVVDPQDPAALVAELSRQLEAFVQLMGRPPSHLDSHQRVHRKEPLRCLVGATAGRLGIPVRDLDPSVTYCGGFYGQSGRGETYPEGITLAALLALLDGLGPGTTELGSHRGPT